MAVTKEEVVEFISNMTVLELSEFIKELEEKFGVSAAAPAAAMVMAAPAAGAAEAHAHRQLALILQALAGPLGQPLSRLSADRAQCHKLLTAITTEDTRSK